jgi:hypothetical protein
MPTPRLPFAGALLACASILVPLDAARADSCETPRVLFTVDRSSSMLDPVPGASTKWEAARIGIAEMAAALSAAELGVQVFPFPDACHPGEIVLDLAPGVEPDAVVASLGAPPPRAGHYTPMAQTLDRIAEIGPMGDPDLPRHVVLVTDGWQWCDPHDPAVRFTPVAAVERLADMGITVHVVGFGAGVDALTLNRAAIAAGTAHPGCDPALRDPMATGHCYAQAHDLEGLRAALGAISRAIVDEVCNGEDDDCDGRVDEGFDRDGDHFTTCGSDPAGKVPLDAARADCDDAIAETHPGGVERCNATDDDCDGAVDEGCECGDGQVRPCGTDVGVCVGGMQRCMAGHWGACTGTVRPAPVDACDGRDEDCDGTTDEDARCEPGMLCDEGACIAPVLPDGGPSARPEGPPSLDAGCACAAGGMRLAPAALLPFVLVGGYLLARRRVRRRR